MNRPAKEVSRAEYANLITRFAGRIFHRVDTIKEKGKEVRYRYFVKSAGSKQVTRAIGPQSL